MSARGMYISHKIMTKTIGVHSTRSSIFLTNEEKARNGIGRSQKGARRKQSLSLKNRYIIVYQKESTFSEMNVFMDKRETTSRCSLVAVVSSPVVVGMRQSLARGPLPSPANAIHSSVFLLAVSQWVSWHDPTCTAARLPGGQCN
jgi:hypothetical protein